MSGRLSEVVAPGDPSSRRDVTSVDAMLLQYAARTPWRPIDVGRRSKYLRALLVGISLWLLRVNSPSPFYNQNRRTNDDSYGKVIYGRPLGLRKI